MTRSIALCIGAAVLLAGCSPQAKVEKHLERGNAYFEEGKYQEATLEYLNVLREDRSNQVAILRSGLAHYELGDPTRAAAFLQAAESADPDNLEVREKLGSLYGVARMIPQVREEALEILKRDPDHFEGLILLTESSFQPEELADAEARWKERESLYGDRERYHLALAQVFLRQGRPEECEKSLQRALELAPGDPRVLEALGDFYGARNEPEKAAEYLEQAAAKSKPVSAARVKWAALQYEQGNTEQANADLRRMVAEEPTFLPAWLRLGEYALQEQRPDEAREAAEALLAVNPNHRGGRLLRARVNLVTGKTEEAIEELQALSQENPRSGALHYQLGLAYLRNGQVDLCRRELAQAVELDPNLVRASLQLAELNIRTGNVASAIRDLEALIAARNDFPDAVLLLGRAYAVNGEPRRAVDTFRALEQLEPDGYRGPFLQGEMLLREKQNVAARAAFERALARSPDSATIISRLATLDLREDQGDAAIARVKAAIETHPQQPGLHKMLGVIHAQLGQQNLAEEAFRQELAIAPEDMSSYLALSRLLMQQGRLDDALQQVEDALAVEPDDARSLMLSGMFHEQKRDYPTAVQRYERVLEVAPQSAQAANNAAYLLATQLGKVDRAFELAKKARELAPEDPAIADTLGWIAYQRGEYPWALTLVQEAAETFIDNPEVQYHVGMAQLAAGNEAKARAALLQALEVDPGGTLPKAGLLRELTVVLEIPVEEVSARDAERIETVLAKDPANPAARVRLAKLLEQKGAYTEARDAYREVLNAFPQFLPAAVALIDLCDGPLGDPAQALDWAKKARAQDQADPGIAQRAGWLAVRNGDVGWGLGLLQEAARARPQDASIRYQLAVSSYLQGNEQAALDLISDASGLDNDGKRLGLFLQTLRRRSANERVLALAEQVPEGDPLAVAARMVVAQAREATGRIDEATAIYEGLLDRVPGFAPAAREAARLYAGPLDDPDKAVGLATRAREALPGDAVAAATLGKIMVRREDNDYAVRLLQEALRAQPDDAESLYFLGFAEHGRGQDAAARSALERALQLAPASAHAARARQLLGEME